MSFEYEGTAKVSAVRLCREGKDEDKVLAVELTASVQVDRDFMAHFHPDLGAFLWNGDEPRFINMPEVRFDATVHRMEMELMAFFANDVMLDKFIVSPLPLGKAGLTFRARWRPESNDVAIVSEALVQPEVELKLTPMPALDLDGRAASKSLRKAASRIRKAVRDGELSIEPAGERG